MVAWCGLFLENFKYKFLYNQCQDSGHHSRMLPWNNSNSAAMRKSYEECIDYGWGTSELISYAVLKRTRNPNFVFLKDDCVYFHISVHSVAAKCKPWLICSPAKVTES